MNTPIPTLTTKTFWIKLNDSQLLLVHGPDANKFLQGQVTCDLRELNDQITRIGAQCNPKGRILLTFRALQIDPETIALRIPASMLAAAKQSLGKYIVFSKAKLVDGQGDYHLYGLYGEQAHTVANALFSCLPTDNEAFIENEGNFLIQLDTNRYECWIPASNHEIFSHKLAACAKQEELDKWSLLDIQAGIASIYPETHEQFTPQEINYQLVNAISFRKGCYTGQEIVARLHYRGKLKRHMYRFNTLSEQLPLPGDEVINSMSGQPAGQIVMATKVNAGKIEILASVFDEQLDELTLVMGSQKLKRCLLPYAIPTADEKNE